MILRKTKEIYPNKGKTTKDYRQHGNSSLENGQTFTGLIEKPGKALYQSYAL